MKNLVITLIVIALLSSCYKSAEIKKPENKLTEQQMAQVLTEIHIIDAMVDEENTNEESTQLHEAFYNFIYKKYGMDRRDFVENLQYYTNTNKMDEIYTQVVAKLEKLEQKHKIETQENTQE